MTPDEPDSFDENLIESLLDYDQRLAAGDTADWPTDREDPLDEARDCLRQLEEVWPRAAEPPTVPVKGEMSSRFGRFVIIAELGRGGFGVVFLAEDPTLGRKIALKVPRPELLVSIEGRRRFLREAQAAASLDHPNLVSVYEAGEVGPVGYIASAYCAGPTLAAWLRERAEPVPPGLAADLLATLAEAVEHAHSRGILHRDLKPSNVLLQASARGLSALQFDIGAWYVPRITDFGLAKLLDSPQDESLASPAAGSPPYMAPEQAEGQMQRIGPPTDVYALGVVLYEVLIGQPPLRGETPFDTLRRVVNEEPVSPRRLRPKLPRDLETIVMTCLRKDHRQRYPTAAALAADLRRFLNGRPIAARPTSIWERLEKWARRQPAQAVLVAVLLVAAVGSVAATLWTNAWLHQHNLALTRAKGRADRNAREAETLRALAEDRAHRLERHHFAALVRMAHRDWEEGHVEQAQELLGDLRDTSGSNAPQRFSWAYLWRLVSRDILLLRGHQAEVFPLAVSPSGRFLASGDNGGTVVLWNLNDGTRRAVLSGPGTRKVGSMAFSPDDRILASTDYSPNRPSEVILWDVATGRSLTTLPAEVGEVHALAFGLEGSTLAALCNMNTNTSTHLNRVLKVWDVSRPSGPPILRWSLPDIDEIALAPGGRSLATADTKGEVCLRDLANGRVSVVCQGGPLSSRGLAFSTDGRRLFAGGQTKDAQSWELPSGRPLVRFKTDYGVKQVLLTPNGQTLVTTNPEGRLDLWDALTGHPQKALEAPPPWIDSVALSPDGQTLAAVSHTTVVVWDLASGASRTYPYPTGFRHRAVFTTDSRHLIFSSSDPVVRLWRLELAPEPPQLGHAEETWASVFSPDGHILATAGNDDTVKLWDPANGQELATLRGHEATVTTLAFSPDGRTLVSGSLDGSARLWDLASRQTRLVLGRHEGGLRGLAISPDGRRLATSGSDQLIRLWSLPDGRPGPI
ncbi:MAG: protein kinase, partial [Isosphaeraceae bacterium]